MRSSFIAFAPSYVNSSCQNRFKCCNLHDLIHIFLHNGVVTTLSLFLYVKSDNKSLWYYDYLHEVWEAVQADTMNYLDGNALKVKQTRLLLQRWTNRICFPQFSPFWIWFTKRAFAINVLEIIIFTPENCEPLVTWVYIIKFCYVPELICPLRCWSAPCIIADVPPCCADVPPLCADLPPCVICPPWDFFFEGFFPLGWWGYGQIT